MLSILPRMTLDATLEVTRIYSVAGRLKEHGSLVRRRPFRAPHHTISPAGLVGGGAGWARPGELSLAHRGVLFLDELPEFGHTVLDVMRQPLEDGVVSLGRSRGTIVFPARFMVVGAMNPCPWVTPAIRRAAAPVSRVPWTATRSAYPARCSTA